MYVANGISQCRLLMKLVIIPFYHQPENTPLQNNKFVYMSGKPNITPVRRRKKKQAMKSPEERRRISAKMAQHRVHLREACRRFYEEGVPKRDLISEYGFPERTLNMWLRSGRWRLPERECTAGCRYLPDDVEVMLAAWLVANAEIGHPVLKPVLLIMAFTIAKDLGAKIKQGSRCMQG